MICFDQAGAGDCGSHIAPPEAALTRFVEHFWVQYALDPKTCQSLWRIVPDVNAQIIVVVSRDTTSLEGVRCAIVGARSRFADISLANRALTLGVRLQPGALPLLTRLPASDFTDRSVSIEEALGLRGRQLSEQLTEQRSVAGRLRVLTQFLSNELGGGRESYPGLNAVASVDRAGELAAVLGVPNRTLYAHMKEQIGLAPKRLLRIMRMHRALSSYRGRPASWAELSASCGFSDQAHLAREFQDLLGESPSAWQARGRSCRFVQDMSRPAY